jgi:antitoxin Phd
MLGNTPKLSAYLRYDPWNWRLIVAKTKKTKDADLGPPEAGRVVTVSSTEAQNALGDLLDRVGKGARVVVTRYNRRQAVILSAEEYDTLRAEEEVDLSTLEREFDQLVARMQTPKHRGAVEALFRLSGEELGKAAVIAGEADWDDP